MSAVRGLSRRRFLANTVAVATTGELQRAARAMGMPAAAPVCKLAAEQEVGPYYVADEMVRADIREGKPGLPLQLRLLVLDARTCRPLPHAAVDAWHCDALGLYAGYTKVDPTGMGPGGPPPGLRSPHPDLQHPGNWPGPPEGAGPGAPKGMGPPPGMHVTDKMTFLRGIQFTGAQGEVVFHTVFPGFYMGRTNHIHFKVREGGHTAARPTGAGETYAAGHTAHVGQVFFPEACAAELMRHEPYSAHTIHRTTQAEDMVFGDQHGVESVAELRAVDAKRPEAGFVAELVVAVDPTATPKAAGRGGPGRPGGPPPDGFRPPPPQ